MPRDDLRERVAEALYQMRYNAALSQAEVAKRMQIATRTYANLEGGTQRIYLDQLLAAERACGRPAGTVLRGLGVLVDAKSTEDVIAADPRLNDDSRAIVLAAYRVAVSRSAG